jgi:hypothetical protein
MDNKAKRGRSTGPRLRTRNLKRQEADVITAPTGVLDRRTLLAARAAAGALPEPVARHVCAPADDGDGASQRRVVLAPFAPEPYPRRGAL